MYNDHSTAYLLDGFGNYPFGDAYGFRDPSDAPPDDSALFNALGFDSLATSPFNLGLSVTSPYPFSIKAELGVEPLDAPMDIGTFFGRTLPLTPLDSSVSQLPQFNTLEQTAAAQGAFDRLASVPGCSSVPSSPPEQTPPLALLGQFHIDKAYDCAEAAMRARVAEMSVSHLGEMETPKYISPRALMQPTGLPTSPKSEKLLKRRLFPEEVLTSRSAPVSPLAYRSRVLAPMPRRARKELPASTDAGRLSPLQPIAPTRIFTSVSSSTHSASASLSSTPFAPSPLRLESDDEGDGDDEYSPRSEGRVRKRQKTSPQSSPSKCSTPRRVRTYGRTQYQRVLESLPLQLRSNIKEEGGVVHCPFPGCAHTAESQGDMGRHFESDIHATHKFICLDPKCLKDFSREDSMKRHHTNQRGKQHKVAHDRMVRMGFDARIPRDQISDVGKRVKELALPSRST